MLGRLVTIPVNSAAEPPLGDTEVCPDRAELLGTSRMEVMQQMSSMQRKVWEVTKD